jgi:hypothetical protein
LKRKPEKLFETEPEYRPGCAIAIILCFAFWLAVAIGIFRQAATRITLRGPSISNSETTPGPVTYWLKLPDPKP